jgi:hypothetical protein
MKHRRMMQCKSPTQTFRVTGSLQRCTPTALPDALVDKGKAILLRLCEAIEVEKPSSLEALYALTQAATDEFNALAKEFYPRMHRVRLRLHR